ncbi:MAG: YceI family protein [Cyclobacteriaceae bacterium]
MRKISMLAGVLGFSIVSFAQTTWNLDKNHTTIGFTTTHMVVSEVDGRFTEFDGKVVSKSDDFDGAEVEFTAQVASVSTENERRDNHLKSDDFFSAEKYPTISFKGKLMKDGGKYKLQGQLTMRDVTKDVTFDVTYGGSVDTGRGVKAGFKITGTINRQEFGLKWANKLASGDLVVADDVQIICRVELNKAA